MNRQAVGVIEVKKKGSTLSGVEWQTVKYQANLPDALPAYLIDGRVPYGYESTGDEPATVLSEIERLADRVRLLAPPIAA